MAKSCKCCNFSWLCLDNVFTVHFQTIFIIHEFFEMSQILVLLSIFISVVSGNLPCSLRAARLPYCQIYLCHKYFLFCTFKMDPLLFQKKAHLQDLISCARYHFLLCVWSSLNCRWETHIHNHELYFCIRYVSYFWLRVLHLRARLCSIC